MARPAKFMRNFSRSDAKNFSSIWLGTFLVVSLALLVLSATYVVSFPSLSYLFSSHDASPGVQVDEKIVGLRIDSKRENVKKMRKPLCDTSSKRADICEIEGDIRILGSSSSVSYVIPPDLNATELQGSWQIIPHPRKGMPHVTKLSVKSLHSYEDAPKCQIKSLVPVIIFSVGGYMGNFFHDFADALVPLYLTSSHFNGEVQFLIGDIFPPWIEKYKEIFKGLSHYEIIDFNQDNVVRCYSNVIVGLKFHKDMSIDPTLSGGLSMVDFGRFLRKTYGLKRDTAIKLGVHEQRKPRMLIIARKSSRRFDNIPEITRYVEWMGFEVVAVDKQLNKTIGNFAELVNSCDVMLGVHGAGLTNLVFLPTNAVVIQVVPLGGLESLCWSDFGVATLDMKLHYIQYSISPAESTLAQEYSATNPDFPVLTDPKLLLRRDVRNWTDTYFFQQGVKLDLDRFSSVLLQTLELLRDK